MADFKVKVTGTSGKVTEVDGADFSSNYDKYAQYSKGAKVTMYDLDGKESMVDIGSAKKMYGKGYSYTPNQHNHHAAKIRLERERKASGEDGSASSAAKGMVAQKSSATPSKQQTVSPVANNITAQPSSESVIGKTAVDTLEENKDVVQQAFPMQFTSQQQEDKISKAKTPSFTPTQKLPEDDMPDAFKKADEWMKKGGAKDASSILKPFSSPFDNSKTEYANTKNSVGFDNGLTDISKPTKDVIGLDGKNRDKNMTIVSTDKGPEVQSRYYVDQQAKRRAKQLTDNVVSPLVDAIEKEVYDKAEFKFKDLTVNGVAEPLLGNIGQGAMFGASTGASVGAFTGLVGEVAGTSIGAAEGAIIGAAKGVVDIYNRQINDKVSPNSVWNALQTEANSKKFKDAVEGTVIDKDGNFTPAVIEYARRAGVPTETYVRQYILPSIAESVSKRFENNMASRFEIKSLKDGILKELEKGIFGWNEIATKSPSTRVRREMAMSDALTEQKKEAKSVMDNTEDKGDGKWHANVAESFAIQATGVVRDAVAGGFRVGHFGSKMADATVGAVTKRISPYLSKFTGKGAVAAENWAMSNLSSAEKYVRMAYSSLPSAAGNLSTYMGVSSASAKVSEMDSWTYDDWISHLSPVTRQRYQTENRKRLLAKQAEAERNGIDPNTVTLNDNEKYGANGYAFITFWQGLKEMGVSYSEGAAEGARFAAYMAITGTAFNVASTNMRSAAGRTLVRNAGHLSEIGTMVGMDYLKEGDDIDWVNSITSAASMKVGLMLGDPASLKRNGKEVVQAARQIFNEGWKSVATTGVDGRMKLSDAELDDVCRSIGVETDGVSKKDKVMAVARVIDRGLSAGDTAPYDGMFDKNKVPFKTRQKMLFAIFGEAQSSAPIMNSYEIDNGKIHFRAEDGELIESVEYNNGNADDIIRSRENEAKHKRFVSNTLNLQNAAIYDNDFVLGLTGEYIRENGIEATDEFVGKMIIPTTEEGKAFYEYVFKNSDRIIDYTLSAAFENVNGRKATPDEIAKLRNKIAYGNGGNMDANTIKVIEEANRISNSYMERYAPSKELSEELGRQDADDTSLVNDNISEEERVNAAASQFSRIEDATSAFNSATESIVKMIDNDTTGAFEELGIDRTLSALNDGSVLSKINEYTPQDVRDAISSYISAKNSLENAVARKDAFIARQGQKLDEALEDMYARVQYTGGNDGKILQYTDGDGKTWFLRNGQYEKGVKKEGMLTFVSADGEVRFVNASEFDHELTEMSKDDFLNPIRTQVQEALTQMYSLDRETSGVTVPEPKTPETVEGGTGNAPETGENYTEKGNNTEDGALDNKEDGAEEEIPVDKKGRKLYTQVSPQATFRDFVKRVGGDTNLAGKAVIKKIKDAEEKLGKLRKKLEKEDDIDKLESLKKEEADTVSELEYWNKVKDVFDKVTEEEKAKEEQRLKSIEDESYKETKESPTYDTIKSINDIESEIAEAERKVAEAEMKGEYDRAAKGIGILRALNEKLDELKELAKNVDPELEGIPDVSIDKASDARERGFRVQNGVKIERQGEIDSADGKDISIIFSNEDTVQGKLAVVDADNVQPSHLSGHRNVRFFINEAQPKDRTDNVSEAASDKIANDVNTELVGEGPTAYVGAPIINARGEVIQGNNRAVGLKKMQNNPEQRAKYKQWLMENAEAFGLKAEDIEKIENPVLVRKIDVDDAEAIRLGQFDDKSITTGGESRIEAKKVFAKAKDEHIDWITRHLFSTNEDNADMTVGQLIDKNGIEVLKYMRDQKLISDSEYQGAFNKNGTGLSSEGKNDLKKLMLHNILDGGVDDIEKMFESLPSAAQNALIQSMAGDGRLPKDCRLVQNVQNAIVASNEIKAFIANHKDAKIPKDAEGWAGILRDMSASQDMFSTSKPFSERYSALDIKIATLLLSEGQNKIKAVFKEYQKLIVGNGATLFESAEKLDRASALERVFNIKEDKNDGKAETGNAPVGGGKGELPGGEGSGEGNGGSKGVYRISKDGKSVIGKFGNYDIEDARECHQVETEDGDYRDPTDEELIEAIKEQEEGVLDAIGGKIPEGLSYTGKTEFWGDDDEPYDGYSFKDKDGNEFVISGDYKKWQVNAEDNDVFDRLSKKSYSSLGEAIADLEQAKIRVETFNNLSLEAMAIVEDYFYDYKNTKESRKKGLAILDDISSGKITEDDILKRYNDEQLKEVSDEARFILETVTDGIKNRVLSRLEKTVSAAFNGYIPRFNVTFTDVEHKAYADAARDKIVFARLAKETGNKAYETKANKASEKMDAVVRGAQERVAKEDKFNKDNIDKYNIGDRYNDDKGNGYVIIGKNKKYGTLLIRGYGKTADEKTTPTILKGFEFVTKEQYEKEKAKAFDEQKARIAAFFAKPENSGITAEQIKEQIKRDKDTLKVYKKDNKYPDEVFIKQMEAQIAASEEALKKAPKDNKSNKNKFVLRKDSLFGLSDAGSNTITETSARDTKTSELIQRLKDVTNELEKNNRKGNTDNSASSEANSSQTANGQTKRLQEEQEIIRHELKRRELFRKNFAKKFGIGKDGTISMDSIKDIFETYNENENRAKVFNMIFDIAKRLRPNAKLKFLVDDEDTGGYFGRWGSLRYSMDIFSRATGDEKAHIIAHELIHSITSNIIDSYSGIRGLFKFGGKDANAVATLKRIHKAVLEAGYTDKYGASNVKESIAEITDKEYYDILKGITIDNRSGWDVVKDIFFDEIGRSGANKNEVNALEASLNALESIVKDFDYETHYNLKNSLSGTIGKIFEYISEKLGISGKVLNFISNADKFLIGEEGAARLDSEYDTTAFSETLREAERMEKEGTDVNDIWRKTGWERGKDGKWRTEILDMKIKGGSVKLSKESTLGKVFEADELFEAYPDIADIKIKKMSLREFMETDADAMYDDEEGVIKVMLGDDNVLGDAQLINVLHEVQHAIQYREGFETGSSESQVKWNSSGIAKQLKEQVDSLSNEIQGKLEKERERIANEKGWSKYMRKAHANELEAEARKNLNDNDYEFVMALDKFRDVFGRYRALAHEMGHPFYRSEKYNDPTKIFEIYKAHAGEVEARNVQYRHKLTDKQRAKFSPSSTEDFERDEQLFGIGGGSNMFIGSKRKAEMDSQLSKKRPDMSEEQRKQTIAEIEKLGEKVKVGGDPKTEKLAQHWVLKGNLILPEDEYKLLDAMDVAQKKGIDPFSYDNPTKLLMDNSDVKPSSRPINPDTVKQSHIESMRKNTEETINGLGGKGRVISSKDDLDDRGKAALKRNSRAKGWYDTTTGEVCVYLPNCKSEYDAQRVVYHEKIGHEGMREAFGKEGFNKFCDNLWMSLTSEERAPITQKAQRNGWDYRTAIDEYLAEKAEDFDAGNNNYTLWQKVKDAFNLVANKVFGYKGKMSVNDVRTAMWLSKNALENKTGNMSYRLRKAAFEAKMRNVKYKELTKSDGWTWADSKGDTEKSQTDIINDILFSSRMTDEQRENILDGLTPEGRATIINYNSRLKNWTYAWGEAYGDRLKSARILVETITGKKGNDIDDKYNIVNKLEALPSKNLQEQQKVDRELVKPLLKTLDDLTPLFDGDVSYERYKTLEAYAYAKHALERNRVLAVRDFVRKMSDTDDEQVKQNAKAIQIAFDAKRADLKTRLDAGTITLRDYYDELDEFINKYFDFDASKADMSGLSDIKSDRFFKLGFVTGKKGEYRDGEVINFVMNCETKVGKDNVDRLWSNLEKLSKSNTEREYSAGLLGKNARERMDTMFSWYLPLRGFDAKTAEEMYGYIGTSGMGTGETSIKALGRTSHAETPISTLLAVTDYSILRSNRNRAKLPLLVLARENKNALLTEYDVWYKEENGTLTAYYPDINDEMSPSDIHDKIEKFNADIEARIANGEKWVKLKDEKTNTPYRIVNKHAMQQHFVTVYVDGKPVTLMVNGNPRAAQAINGAVHDTHWVGVDNLNRMMSQLMTSYSYTFMMRNAVRDYLYASSSGVVADFGAGEKWNRDFQKTYLALATAGVKDGVNKDNNRVPGMLMLFHKYRNNTLDMNNEIHKYFKEFVENGGMTGYTEMNSREAFEKTIRNTITDSIDDGTDSDNILVRNACKFISKTRDAKAVKIAELPVKGLIKAFGGWFNLAETCNESVENHARFSAYCASRINKRSIDRSIHDAKEISVNFNRTGAGWGTHKLNVEDSSTMWKINRDVAASTATFLRHAMWFFNPAVQGMSRTYDLMTGGDWKQKARFIGAYVVAPMLAYSAAYAASMMFAAGDDDETRKKYGDDPFSQLPDHVRRDNFCMYIGNGRFITIPIDIEQRAMYGLADVITRQLQGKRSDKGFGAEVFEQFTQLTPMDLGGGGKVGINGIPGSVIGTVTPSDIQPVVACFTNVGWTGSPLYSKNEKGAAWTHGLSTTSHIWTNTAKALSIATGGDEYGAKAGWININPGIAEYVCAAYFGGPGKESSEIVTQVYNASSKNEEFDFTKLPVFKAFLRSARPENAKNTDRSRWYRYVEDAQKTQDMLSIYRKNHARIDYTNLKESKDGRISREVAKTKERVKHWQERKNKAKTKIERDHAMYMINDLISQAIERIDIIEDTKH